MASKNVVALAGEFLVAGELSRRGYPISITMGNAKAVDIYADCINEGKIAPIRIDAKASRYKTSWPIGTIDKYVYYIFVSLQTEAETSKNKPPDYFIVSGEEILKKNLLKQWKNMAGIKYATLNTKATKDGKEKWDYKKRWDKLPRPQ